MSRRAFLIDVLAPAQPELFGEEGDLRECRQASPAHACLLGILERLGFEQIVWSTGAAATREVILARLDRWIEQSQPGDVCLFYYTGHGARVRFLDDRRQPLIDENLTALTVGASSKTFSALLDIELSQRLTALDVRCGARGSVTAIIDCCHSGDAVRGASGRGAPGSSRRATTRSGEAKRGYEILTFFADPWVETLLDEVMGAETPIVATDGHPNIVRLAGASPWRVAFCDRGKVGLMTAALVESITEVLDHDARGVERLTWGMLVHRVREVVIQRRKMEEQWVTLAGPHERLLFSPDSVEIPRAVGFVPDGPGRGYLRAGWLGGVAIGDRWAVAEHVLGEDLEPTIVARGSVVALESNRAELELDGESTLTQPAMGSCALLERAANPMSVGLRSARALPDAARTLVDRSAWVSREPVRVAADGDQIALLDRDDRTLFEAASDEHGLLRERLEDLARRERLFELLAGHPTREGGEVQWQVWHHPRGAAAREPLGPGGELHCGDGISFTLTKAAKVPRTRRWFVAVVHVDVGGRLTLMHVRQPEGLELGPGASEPLGSRPGGGRRGLRLTWPEGTPRERPLPATFVLLACRRPMNLANLVRWQVRDMDEAFHVQGMTREGVRGATTRGGTTRDGRRPEPADSWCWRRLDVVVNPNAPTSPGEGEGEQGAQT